MGDVAEFKYAGFDHLEITGRAPRPMYLLITDGTARLMDASHLWGMDTFETEDTLKEEQEDPCLRVACIGPAGERQEPGSLILVDRAKGAGGSGVGCVMGSKRLKAIAVRGIGIEDVAARLSRAGRLAG